MYYIVSHCGFPSKQPMSVVWMQVILEGHDPKSMVKKWESETGKGESQ